MSDLLPLFLAGLAFFFVGVAGISEHLRQISGRGLRQRLARLTRHPLRAGLCGLLFGMLTQSASAVAFILAGMISTGLMAVRRALPVLACANVGTALLVFLAALDIRVAALYLLGVSGIVVAFKVTGRWRAAAGTSFAVGMLFYGLVLMKQAVAPLPGHPDFAAVVAFIQGWPYAAFVLGAMLRIVVQSSSAIGVIAVTLAGAGLLNDLQAMLLLCGVCVGVGLAAYLMSAGLAGIPRQIIAYQALINVVAGSVFAVLLLAEHLSGTPLILGGLQAFASSLDGRIAAFYLLLMLGCLGAGLALQPWAPLWIERWFPPTPDQDLWRPAYIHDDALDVPETALALVDKEQLRLVKLLPAYCETARCGHADDSPALHEAAGRLADEISGFLQELVRQPCSDELACLMLAYERRLDLLRPLEANVYQFVQTLGRIEPASPLAAVAGRLLESMDAIIAMAADALDSLDTADVDLLLRVTDDRGEMMEQLRTTHQTAGAGRPMDEHSALHYATSLFERNIWLLRQLGLWLRSMESAGYGRV